MPWTTSIPSVEVIGRREEHRYYSFENDMSDERQKADISMTRSFTSSAGKRRRATGKRTDEEEEKDKSITAVAQ